MAIYLGKIYRHSDRFSGRSQQHAGRIHQRQRVLEADFAGVWGRPISRVNCGAVTGHRSATRRDGRLLIYMPAERIARDDGLRPETSPTTPACVTRPSPWFFGIPQSCFSTCAKNVSPAFYFHTEVITRNHHRPKHTSSSHAVESKNNSSIVRHRKARRASGVLFCSEPGVLFLCAHAGALVGRIWTQ